MLRPIPRGIRRAVALAIRPEGRPGCPPPSPHEDSPEDPVPPPVPSGIEMAARPGTACGALKQAVAAGQVNAMPGAPRGPKGGAE